MGNSLQDQLLKAGMVNKKKVQSAKKAKHKQKVNAKKGEMTEAELAKIQAEKVRQEKAEKDRLLNQQKNEQAQQKAIQAQIRQLIEVNRINNAEGETAYNFTDQKKIKRIYITDALIDALSSGSLSVATLDDQYHLIPKAVAEKIQQRDESVIVVLNEKTEAVDEDDPYAAYQIPDDLMW